jgi:tetratricopeptide (TPR) repeat protein
MALYAYFEDAQKAEALCAKYKEEDSAAMLLPLSLVYYRTGRYQEAQEVLKKIYQRNPDLKRFCAEVMDGSIDERGMGKYYRPDSIEELVMLYYNYDYAYNDTCFFMWAERVVKTFPRPRTRKKTKK